MAILRARSRPARFVSAEPGSRRGSPSFYLLFGVPLFAFRGPSWAFTSRVLSFRRADFFFFPFFPGFYCYSAVLFSRVFFFLFISPGAVFSRARRGDLEHGGFSGGDSFFFSFFFFGGARGVLSVGGGLHIGWGRRVFPGGGARSTRAGSRVPAARFFLFPFGASRVGFFCLAPPTSASPGRLGVSPDRAFVFLAPDGFRAASFLSRLCLEL